MQTWIINEWLVWIFILITTRLYLSKWKLFFSAPWQSFQHSQPSLNNSNQSTPLKSSLKALRAPLQAKANKFTCTTKEPWRTERSSIQATTEDSHLISTSASVKSSSAGMKSVSTWKSDQKLKSSVQLKLPTEAEPSDQSQPTQTLSSSSKESNEWSSDINIFHSF